MIRNGHSYYPPPATQASSETPSVMKDIWNKIIGIVGKMIGWLIQIGNCRGWKDGNSNWKKLVVFSLFWFISCSLTYRITHLNGFVAIPLNMNTFTRGSPCLCLQMQKHGISALSVSCQQETFEYPNPLFVLLTKLTKTLLHTSALRRWVTVSKNGLRAHGVGIRWWAGYFRSAIVMDEKVVIRTGRDFLFSVYFSQLDP